MIKKVNEISDRITRTPGYSLLEKMAPKIALLVGVLWILWGSYVFSLDANSSPAQIMIISGIGWIAISYGLKRFKDLSAAKKKTYNLMLLFNKKMKGVNTYEDKMLVDFMWCLFNYDAGTKKLNLKWKTTRRVACNGTAVSASVKALEDIKAAEIKGQELEPQDLTTTECDQFSLVIEKLVLGK